MIQSKRLVISIDGGGIRGIIPLILLKQIQRRAGKDLFSHDLSWWGTSTGALISGAVTIQSTAGSSFESAVQNVLDLYEFRSAAAVRPHGVSIPTRALNQMIKANFGHLHLNEFPNLNIVVAEQSDLSPVILNSANPCPLDMAILASCAFPGVFPPVEIGGKLYVDGFFNAKNPTKIAHHYEISQAEKPIIHLSLGTGVLRTDDAVERAVNGVHSYMSELSESENVRYFRFNPILNHAVDSMQNTSAKNILGLRKDTLEFIAANEHLISNLLELLD